MKKITFLLIIFLLAISGTQVVFAQDGETDLLNSQLESIDFSEIQSYLNQIDQDVGQYLPELNIKNLLQNIRKGNIDISYEGAFKGFTKFFFHEILTHSKLLGTLIILTVLHGVLENIHSGFEGNNLRKITFWVCSLALYTIALGSFTLSMGIAKESIDSMVAFFNSLIPVLITLIVSVGHITSAAILSPLTVATTGFFSNLINQIVMPLIYICTVLYVLDHISQNFKVSNLAKLCRDTAIGIIGLSLTIYIAVLNIQGVAGNVSDGVVLETAKFATGSFIPVVGKFLSDALEVVVGTSLLIKSAVSVVGIILIGLLCIFPLLKILALVIIYRVAAAFIQPFGAKPISDTLNTIGNCLLLVFGAVASVGLMLFIGISILVKVGKPF
jgi:stage III sporulation protein AE